MKVLVTGANGQLARCLNDLEPNWIYLDRTKFDLSSRTSIESQIKNLKPDVIINCAAYTNVELAEDESEKAHLINGYNLKCLATTNAHIIHISTDYVFDGTKDKPYFIDEVPKPINEYGKSKLLGERIIQEFSKNYTIIRTSWVYSEYGKNFFKTIFHAAQNRPELKVVNDQWGSPTYARDLAKFIISKVNNNSDANREILHFTGRPYCTWFDFASEIVKYSNPDCKVTPVSSSEFPTKAKRPQNSMLYCGAVHGSIDVDWKQSLKECVLNYLIIDKK